MMKEKRRYRPQRYPSCAGDGREQSKLSGEGSCAGGKGIRTFHSGSGRSCCRHGRTAYPVSRKTNLSTNILIYRFCIGDGFDRSCSLSRPSVGAREFIERVVWREDKTHLSGVDLLTAERIVVGTHLERERCATGWDEMLSIGVGWLSRIGLFGGVLRETGTILWWCGVELAKRHT